LRRQWRYLELVLLLTFLGCAPALVRFPGPLGSLGREPSPAWQTPSHDRRPGDTAPSTPEAVASAAAGFVGDRTLVVNGETFRSDCSGLVEASLASAGCAFKGSSAMLFEQARSQRVLHRHRMPSPGDVAFFDDTYDRNGNGKIDDPLSHVAVVESVDRDGTIHLVHRGSQGVARIVMNLKHPEERFDADGKLINDYLRAHGSKDSPRTRYLAGELWVAFGSFWDAEPSVAEDQAAGGTSARDTR
jgi:hypothetical protein